MVVPGEQQRDSAIHKHASILPQTALPSMLTHNIEQSHRYTFHCYSLAFPECHVNEIIQYVCICLFSLDIMLETLPFCRVICIYGFTSGSAVKIPPANPGDSDWIPGSGRSPRAGNGNPLQYSCLENPMDRGAWQITVHRVAKSWTQLNN